MTLLCVLLIIVLTVAVPLAGTAETLNNRLRGGTADPWLFTDGDNYYLTMTGSTTISVLKADRLSRLTVLETTSGVAYISMLDPTVKELFGPEAVLSGTWSPEIHYYSEEDYPGYSGWYMFLALRNSTGDSSQIKMVVLRSVTGEPQGPYGHPVTGEENRSQPVLGPDGQVWQGWECGMSSLRIPDGEYKGIYAMFVSETGRGLSGKDGLFYQMLMITRMTNPWTMAEEPSRICVPDQEWEYAGASERHPRVVEGATAVYGDRGDIYITYSGSGYWSDYGLGQLTWTGGDPVQASSWVKLSTDLGNPFFQANTSETLRGAGHASFLEDKQGSRFLCYHAYAYTNGAKGKSRSAYIEPYYIDYTRWNGVSYGVLCAGLNGSGVPEAKLKIEFADE